MVCSKPSRTARERGPRRIRCAAGVNLRTRRGFLRAPADKLPPFPVADRGVYLSKNSRAAPAREQGASIAGRARADGGCRPVHFIYGPPPPPRLCKEIPCLQWVTTGVSLQILDSKRVICSYQTLKELCRSFRCGRGYSACQIREDKAFGFRACLRAASGYLFSHGGAHHPCRRAIAPYSIHIMRRGHIIHCSKNSG